MNRQIKFRGFCTTCKEKIEGDLLHGVGSKSSKFFILPIKHNLANIKHCHPLDGVEVFPDSIGQFTGLQDKNGKDIYEGDIIEEGRVLFCNESLGFFVEGEDELKKPLYDIPFTTIIGNIYENPELLKTTENE